MYKEYEKATAKSDEKRNNIDNNEDKEFIEEQKKYNPKPGSQDYRYYIKNLKCPHCLKNSIKIVNKQHYKCDECKKEWIFKNGNPILIKNEQNNGV